MPATNLKLVIQKGRTFTQPLRWEKEPFLFATITNISNSAPIVIETEQAHGIPPGWRVAVVGAKGMTLLNAKGNPPAVKDFRKVSTPTLNTVEFNAYSSALEDSYQGGGYLQFYTPVDLSGVQVRMSIKDEVGGTELLHLDNSVGGLIEVDNLNKAITIRLPATDTAAYTWGEGVYDLEAEDADGVVTQLFYGTVVVVDEVTT